MKNADIKEVARETHRFFEKLRALMLTEDFKYSNEVYGPGGLTQMIPESAAVRRSSMDLTRALAKLRRSGRAK